MDQHQLFFQFYNTRYQLLGDSMLRRYFQFFEGSKVGNFNRVTCHGGQKISELEYNIREVCKYQLEYDSAILMIGTNDLHLNPLDLDTFKADYRKLADTILKTNLKRLVILSLPIVPLLIRKPGFQKFWRNCNTFIRSEIVPIISFASYVSLTSIFWNEKTRHAKYDVFCRWKDFHNPEGKFANEEEKREFFARERRHELQPDLIHWNNTGIEMVSQRLMQQLQQQGIDKLPRNYSTGR
jgi:lysophospholipase L1-like esterase